MTSVARRRVCAAPMMVVMAIGAIRFTHQGYDETTDAAYRREIMILLAEWSESSKRN